jgi:dolichol-phosphate mannosyltransferase
VTAGEDLPGGVFLGAAAEVRDIARPAGAPDAASRTPELTVVVPTLNERDNIAPLVELLDTALAGIAWEVIFVDDDSRDDTAAAVRAMARRDGRVRCLQRIGRRGLSTACIEGVLASAAPYCAVMDADLQHDETVLPRMLEALRTGTYDLAIGSRYSAGGDLGELSGRRVGISKLATRVSRVICKADIADPMSGFFMVRREAFEAAMRRLSGQGFKILLDLLASSPRPLRVVELGYRFRQRRHGESKLDTLVAWEFGMLLADKLVGHVIPVRFVLFATIGAIGLVVHLVVLRLALTLLALDFTPAQTSAALVAMTSNFFLNNLFTYRDQRLMGWRLLRGLMSFYLICGLGLIANVGLAAYTFAQHERWWIAGVAGVVVGSVWNYAISSVFTWKPPR